MDGNLWAGNTKHSKINQIYGSKLLKTSFTNPSRNFFCTPKRMEAETSKLLEKRKSLIQKLKLSEEE
jgi:hypothetical protein